MQGRHPAFGNRTEDKDLLRSRAKNVLRCRKCDYRMQEALWTLDRFRTKTVKGRFVWRVIKKPKSLHTDLNRIKRKGILYYSIKSVNYLPRYWRNAKTYKSRGLFWRNKWRVAYNRSRGSSRRTSNRKILNGVSLLQEWKNWKAYEQAPIYFNATAEEEFLKMYGEFAWLQEITRINPKIDESLINKIN